MEYRRLGSTGTTVSAQRLGTMTFGHESDEEVAHAQLDLFVERGGNFVDSADMYSRGRSEEIIGRWLAARPGGRDRLVIATKGRAPGIDERSRHVPSEYTAAASPPSRAGSVIWSTSR